MPSSETKYIDLINLEEKYSKMLDECYYAGDIVLSEDELLSICNVLKSHTGHIDANKLNNLLLVVGVNIAYFYYDDEGFWKHFYELCNFKGNILSIGMIGRKIEKVLLEKELMKYRRFGPFRYVGAILEQVGITNRNIPAYARLIQEIVRVCGTRNYRNISYQSYKHIVDYWSCSKYLKEYLLDESGWDFTLYTLKIVNYLESGTISIGNLYEFRGVHPRFWEEFFKYYSIKNNRNNKDKASSFAKPFLLYDEIHAGIYIKLPTTGYTLDQIEGVGEKGHKLSVHLNSLDNLISKYVGNYIEHNGEIHRWEIDGWNPSREEYAYFHKRYGYIKKIENLQKGNYYIITNSESNIPKGQIINHLGSLRLLDASNFYVLEVNIKEDIYTSNQFTKVELNWKNKGNLLPVMSYYDIFLGNLPQVTISDVSLLENEKAILLYNIGKETKRIKDYRALSELYRDLTTEKVVKGYIWTDSILRTKIDNGSMYEESIKFCIIPLCELNLPAEIYSTKEKVKFKSTSPFIKYLDSKKIENHLWEINEGIEILEGIIQVNGDEIRFNHTIHRGYIVINNDFDSKYFDYDNLQSNDSIEVYGIPRSYVNIEIDEGIQIHTIIKDIQLDENGKQQLKYGVVKDVLGKLDIDAGKFYLGSNGKHIDANMGYFRFENILIKLSKNSIPKGKSNFIQAIDEKVASKINQILALFHTKQNNLIYIDHDKQTMNLDRLYNFILVMSQIFDRTIVQDEHGSSMSFKLTDIENQDVLETVVWYQNAMNAVKKGLFSNAIALKKEYDNLNWFPEIGRWKNKINELYSELDYLSDTKKIFIEWTEETRKKKKFLLKNNIAHRNGGNQVTIAWIDYLKGSYMNSIEKIANIDLTEDSIIKDLKILLQATIYIKLTRINALRNLINCSTVQSNEVKAVFSIFNNVCRVMSSMEIEVERDAEEVAGIFPFREEDLDLIIKLNMIFRKEINVKNLEEIKMSENWIVNLIAWKLNKKNKELSDVFKSNLRSLISTIPESPEKDDLIKEIIK